MGIVTDLTKVADAIYGVRDAVGAVTHNVFIVTREWSGSEVGSGSQTDSVTQMLPTPGFQNFALNFAGQQAGTVQRGDVLLKGISKQSWPLKADVAFTGLPQNVEKFYRIDGALYQVVQVIEKFISWDVLIRRIANNE